MNVLDRIFEHKAEEVALAKREISLRDIRSMAEDGEPTRGFRRALSEFDGLALIAEIKKASPSKGIIRPDFDVREIAETYEEAGAQCLSVLTDARFFQGSAENLRIAHRTTSLPCLRKDFINDPYQVYEARAWGADALLLIVAALDRGLICDLMALATELAMDVLLEVHSEREVDIALESGSDLVGVNNRDLTDFSVSLSVSERLIPRIAPHALVVSESALETRDDLDCVHAVGAKAVLIGTAFCAAEKIGEKVHEVMGR